MATFQFYDKDNILRTYMHIPKTGGTSVFRWVKTFNEVNILGGHVTIKKLSKNKNLKFGNIFTFIRNPYARLVSTYFYHKDNALEQVQNRRPFVEDKKVLKQWTADYNAAKKMSEYLNNVTFDKWIEDCANNKQTLLLAKKRQVYYTAHAHNIFKLEEIDKVIPILQSWFDVSVEFPVSNTTNHGHYREYYTNKHTRRFVKRYYKKDIEAFGYKF